MPHIGHLNERLLVVLASFLLKCYKNLIAACNNEQTNTTVRSSSNAMSVIYKDTHSYKFSVLRPTIQHCRIINKIVYVLKFGRIFKQFY